MSSGNEGCNCIDQNSVLASLEKRDCTTSTGQPGVYLRPFSSCVSYDYGSSACLQHDLLHDPLCQGDLSTTTVPPYCFQSWCYVNSTSCKKNSEEEIFKSEYFPPQYNIFWSYSTCNSTDHFWQQHLESSANSVSVISGTDLAAIIPDYRYPTMNKQLPGGAVWERTEDNTYYFDDTIPFGGIYIDYIKEIVKISNGDIQNVTFTHTSKGSLKRYPASSFTAAVRDVENDLADMAVGPFWITRQRLKMTTFTVPLVYDKTVLVIPKPERKQNVLAYEVEKVMEPFTYGFWAVAAAIVVVASLLSVWFSDREMLATRNRYDLQLNQTKRPQKRRKFAYFRLIVDAILEKGMFFFSAGIEQDTGASLPHKVLMFGFGFFILIAASAYVANLAAFLTRSGVKTDYGSMKAVITGNVAICGHPALKDEILMKWPNGNWIFPDGRGFHGLVDAYARGDCNVLAIGREDTIMDTDFISRVCDLGLVYTNDVVTENPIAFPITPQLASAFSYWMYTAEKNHGVSLESTKQAFIEENEIKAECEVEFSSFSRDDFAQVSPGNMFFPIIFFVVCVFIAAVFQLRHDSERKKGRRTSIGRTFTLDTNEFKRWAVENGDSDGCRDMQRKESFLSLDEEVDKDDCAMPSSTKMKNDAGIHEDDDAKRGQVCNFPGAGANVSGDEFHDNVAPQSSPASKSIFKVSIDDVGMANEDADTAVKVEDNDISHRIEELVESGVIEEVLDCFDFFQETMMKKLKKDQ
mmetsp:Transcript_30958/g.48486  ORF Transcript_30958/g.48486 Transcript_30958/m.48486 type:complete len:749 (-) Transcript_30958:92-2338(-)